jgi:hypothetical protein
MSNAKASANKAVFTLPYITCRNISSPEDDAAKRKIYSGHARASATLDLEDDENVREYLVSAAGKQKQVPTLVHRAIRKTLQDHPDQFSVLNGGMVIVARGVEVDDKNKVLLLKKPSIINGSQTQGELKRYFQENVFAERFDPSIKYELIVTDDDDLIAEVSIARNFQNDVRPISIAGRRGQLDELEQALQKDHPGQELRKSESDQNSELLDTEKLIQVIFALMPADLLDSIGADTSRVFAYSQKTRALKLFTRLYDDQANDPAARKVYKFFLDVAGVAVSLYEKWKTHSGFSGSRLRSLERDGREIVDVPDGIVFPILGSLSAFFRDSGKRWRFAPPHGFDEQEIVDAAVSVYKEIAEHNPQTMGKSKACYSTLLRLTNVYARLSEKAAS